MDAEELDGACAEKYGYVHHTAATGFDKAFNDLIPFFVNEQSTASYVAQLRDVSQKHLDDPSSNFYDVSRHLLGLPKQK